jgi:2-dehydropantoate 2-reductase
LSGLLEPGGTLLPIQNGGVPQMLGDRLGECVLGGLSNLGATMTEGYLRAAQVSSLCFSL